MINSNYAYNYVYEEILKDLQSLNGNKNDVLPTEKDYCKRFDVSLTTVRRALDRLYAEKIIVKQKNRGVVMNKNVRCLCVPENSFVGVLRISYDEYVAEDSTYQYSNPYTQKIYSEVYRELGADYNILIDTMQKGEVKEKFTQSILTRADKILILGEADNEAIEYLYSLGKFVIVYNYFDKKINVARVNNDERKKFKEVTDYYIKKGYKNIACINGLSCLTEVIERYMGFQDAMVANNLFIEKNFVKWGDTTPESGYTLMKELLENVQKPEVVVCINDGVAMGAYDAILEAGLKVGKDIIVVGHDNCELNEKYNFTTIDPRYNEVGKVISDLLQRKIWIDEEIVVEGEIIYR